MLDPITPLPNPYLAQASVAQLLAHFATALPWLSDAHGLVQTGVDKTGKNRYPQAYRQDGGLDTAALYPDENMKALCFFERDGPSAMQWSDALHTAGEWLHALAAVVWLNLPQIAPGRPDDFSDELASDFLTRGLLQSPLGPYVTPLEIEQRAERLFARYNFPTERQQLLMYPFAGFRIPFTVRQRYLAPCLAPFVLQPMAV